MERSLSPASLALDRQERMYDLYDMVRSGEIRLEQAFMKLGLGFAPAVNERAVAFAVTSSEAFTDLFNACVDEQATQLGRTPKQRSASHQAKKSEELCLSSHGSQTTQLGTNDKQTPRAPESTKL